jgi:D-alanyl-lipoteichoic acid acyltransferase DltB (MBOAT superfamily)
MQIRNTFIIFVVSGFWHGANWTFLIWGGLNALYFMPLLIFKRNRNHMDIVAKGKLLPSLREFLSICTTFILVMLSWIFFRSDSVSTAVHYIRNMFQFNFSSGIQYLEIERYSVELVFLIGLFLLFEWHSREKEHPFFGKWLYFKLVAILLGIIVLGVYSDITSFIYFQF